MVNEFGVAMTACREAYAGFQQLANRTDAALYRALAEVYALRQRMHTNPAIRSSFDELLQQHTAGKAVNETLFLIKYAFFPHTLEPGPGHKSDITKASRYAKLANKALDENIEPADFVAFARQHGIQRTAVIMGKKGPGRRRASRRRGRGPARGIESINIRPRFLTDVAGPLEPWFYSDRVAAQLAQAIADAKDYPRKVSLTIYLNHERAVITGVTGQPWPGKFPDGAIRIPSTAPVDPVAGAARRILPTQLQRPGLPQRRRGVSPSSTYV
jgi:hypothetical protein